MEYETEKNEFYSVLLDTFDNIAKYNMQLKMDDFNAKMSGECQ